MYYYSNGSPNKLAGLYRGPLIIVTIERLDIITDLITNIVMKVHTSRLRLPNQHGYRTVLTAVDLDEFYVEKLLIMWNWVWIQRNRSLRFVGYEPEDDTWSTVKD